MDARRVEPRGEVAVEAGGGERALVERVGPGRHEAPVHEAHLREDLGVGERAGGGGTESEHTLGAEHGVGRGSAEQEALVVVALELSGIRIEDVRRPVEEVPVEGVEDVGRGQITPHAPHPPAHRRGEGGHGTLHAPPDGLVAVVHIVWRRGDDDGRVVLFHDRRELRGDAADRQRKVSVEVDVQRGVEEDRHESSPARGLLRLGAPAVPLVLEAEAGDHADHGPAPVEQVEEGAGAADGLVIGVGCDVEDRGSHQGAGYAGSGFAGHDLIRLRSLFTDYSE